MPQVTQMLGNHTPTPGQRQVVQGIVSHRQLPPAGFDDPLYVVIPAYSMDIYYQCVTWPAMHGGTLPTHGTQVLLVFDDHHQPWCASWVGPYSPPPLALAAHTIVP